MEVKKRTCKKCGTVFQYKLAKFTPSSLLGDSGEVEYCPLCAVRRARKYTSKLLFPLAYFVLKIDLRLFYCESELLKEALNELENLRLLMKV